MFNALEIANLYSGVFMSTAVVFAIYYAIFHARRTAIEARRTASLKALHDLRAEIMFPNRAISEITPEIFAQGIGRNEREDRYIREITQFMNNMEYLAMLVLEDVADERILRRFLLKPLVEAYDSLILHITMLREMHGNPTLYADFEQLAYRWRDEK